VPGALARVEGGAIPAVREARWTAQGKLAVLSSGRALYIVDPASGAVERLSAKTDQVRAMAMADSGRWLATSSGQGRVRLWDLVRGGTTDVGIGFGQWVERMVLDEGEFVLACRLEDGTFRQLKLPGPVAEENMDALWKLVTQKLGARRPRVEGDTQAAIRSEGAKP
jgi:hypothetical protein